MRNQAYYAICSPNLADDIQQAFQTPTANTASRLFSTKDSVSTGQQRLGPLTTVFSNSSPLWYQVTYSPDSIGQTTVRCDVYSTQKPDAHAFDNNKRTKLKERIQAMVHQHEGIYTRLTGQGHNALDGGCRFMNLLDRRPS